MRWSVGAPLVIVSLLASTSAFADMTMRTSHGTIVKAPVLPVKAPTPKTSPIILKAPTTPIAPPSKPFAPIVLGTGKAASVVPGATAAAPGRNVIANRVIVLHRRDVPKAPMLAVAITLPKQTK